MNDIKNAIIKIFNNNLIMGIFLIFLGMFVSYLSGYKDTRWDFTNYHYYNPFAFLNDRLNYDIVPSSLNTFFNPLIDLPLYLIIEYFNDSPDIIIALQGIWYGALLFVFYKFTTLFFDTKTELGILKSLLAVAIASTGQAVYYQLNASTNEISLAFVSFCSLYFIFKMIKFPQQQKAYKFFLCGFILGMALGLKQTILYICLSSGLSLIICNKYIQKPIKFILLFALGGFLGFLITNGWWMYKMWNLYDNPFFPFLNGVFHSPYFDDFNYSDKRFIPPFPYSLIFPYIWGAGKYHSAEIAFYDFRGLMFYTVALIFFIYMTIKPTRWKNFYQKNKLWFFFIIFVVLSYVLWLNIFSIYRYIIVIEMLSAIFFVKIFFLYSPKSNIMFIIYYSIFLILCAVMLLNAKYGKEWHSNKIKEKFVYVETVKMPENTLLKLYNFPTAGVIPVLAKYNNFRALGYQHLNATYMKGSDFVERGKFREIRDKIEKEHQGTEIVIYRAGNPFNPAQKNLYESLEKELNGKYCRELDNNLDNQLYICVPENLKDGILKDGGNDVKSVNPIEERNMLIKMLKQLQKGGNDE